MYTHAARLNRLNVLRGIHSHTARRTAPRSAASNSEIETGVIRAAKSAQYGAVRRSAAPCGAVLRIRRAV